MSIFSEDPEVGHLLLISLTGIGLSGTGGGGSGGRGQQGARL